jgi:hypothetical protein
MLTQAKMTAQEAESYLSSMGIDATVVNDTKTVEETVGYDLVGTPSVVPVEYNPPVENGETAPRTATFATIDYSARPVTVPRTI